MPDYTYGTKSGNLPIDETFLRSIRGLPSTASSPIAPDRGSPLPEPPPLTATPEAAGLSTPLAPRGAAAPALTLSGPVTTPAQPQQNRGFLGDILHGLSSGAETFARYLASPGGRQSAAQLAEVLGRGDPVLQGAARFASNLARNEQYKQIKDAVLKGQTLDPIITAGLTPEEVEAVRQSALAEQDKKVKAAMEKAQHESRLLSEAQQRAQSQAESGLAQARTQEIQTAPSLEEKTAAQKEVAAIQTGIQTFPSGPDKTSSFVFGPDGKPVFLGSGTKTPGEGGGVPQERLDLDQYQQALKEADKEAAFKGIGKLVVDPATGRETLNIMDPVKNTPEYRNIVRQKVFTFTEKGLIKNPAYLKAAYTGIPLEYQGATFTGEFREGKPVYTKEGKLYTIQIPEVTQ